MADKTIQGKKCPNCFSFVKDGLDTCPVCGNKMVDRLKKKRETQVENDDKMKPTIPAERTQSPGDAIRCSKCGTENALDARFCKICKHPLGESQEFPPAETVKPAGIAIAVQWLGEPGKEKQRTSLALEQSVPGFRGFTRWKGYGFFVFKIRGTHDILVKRTGASGDATLFKKCRDIFVLKSGCGFYLGAVKFQLLGDFQEEANSKTVIKSNKTILKGPGEKSQPRFLEGRPRLRIEGISSTREVIEISDTCTLGRSRIAELFGANEDELRQSGVSKEHIAITPYQGGRWLLDPFPDKPVFIEIHEAPVVIPQGDVLRWVLEGQLRECQLFVETGGG